MATGRAGREGGGVEEVASQGLSTCFSPRTRFCSVLQIIDDIGPGQGSTALREAEPRGVGLVAPFSDVIMLLALFALEIWT